MHFEFEEEKTCHDFFSWLLKELVMNWVKAFFSLSYSQKEKYSAVIIFGRRLGGEY